MDIRTRYRWHLVGIGALLHFLVDGLCLCCLYLIAFPFSLPRLAGIFVVYNVLAFLTQPLTGLLADRMHDRQWMLLAAVVLLLAAVMTVTFGFLLPDIWHRYCWAWAIRCSMCGAASRWC